ncbi:MAG TPA: tetratricopeptide repeat protein [Vicinamibacterales bacterium]|nr:tetratricopeptide repeat protein [Vicinamibacterales bacterium]
MSEDDQQEPDQNEQTPLPRPPLIQREVALLVILCAMAVALFAGTQRLAAWSRRLSVENGAMWFARGETAAQRGDRNAALAAFRKAVAADRTSTPYELALARGLADAGHDDEAEQILLRLRDGEPDDIEVNYRLARIAARAGRLDEAQRYYNHALYGIDRTGVPPPRYVIRIELVGFLLDHDDLDAAQDELNALVRELPDTPAAHQQADALKARLERLRPAPPVAIPAPVPSTPDGGAQ